MSIFDEYAQILAALEGDEFQTEVCAHLGTAIIGFQSIPDQPRGDGGLDGLSHEGEHGYCCYGPEHDVFRQARSLEAAIIKKFSSDLRWLLEVEVRRGLLVQIENTELQTILPMGRRIELITLVTNWFESHRIVGPIGTKFIEYKRGSACRYVAPNACCVILGPKDLANRYAVDELTTARARQRSFIRRVKEVAETIKIQDPKDFDYKMQLLREIRPDQVALIDKAAEAFRIAWRVGLAFEQELYGTIPSLHKALEDNRLQILTRIAGLMLSHPQPWTQLPQVTQVTEQIIKSTFDKQYPDLVMEVSSGEIARLIGECPIGWEKPRGANA